MTRVRLTLRNRMYGIVAVAVASLLLVTISSSIYQQKIDDRIASIRGSFLPKIQLRPQLQGGFEKLVRTIQNAVEASDVDLLASAGPDHNHLVAVISSARTTLTAGQMAALRYAVDDYAATATDISRRLIAGQGDEALLAQVREMQNKRDHTATILDQATAFDDGEMATAFSSVEKMEGDASKLRVAITVLCLVLLLLMAVVIGRHLGTHLSALVAGLQRFGRSDFSVPIPATSADEIAEVAFQANNMAEHLRTYDDERANDAWIAAGIAGLHDELRGQLTPHEVAGRSLTYLARYLHAAVGALYGGPPGGPYTLLGQHATSSPIPASFAFGEGLVGEAAARLELTEITAEETGFDLRSGTVASRPRAVLLLPLVHGTAVLGVLELAVTEPARARDKMLLQRVSLVLAITLEVARSRVATEALLEQTRLQAAELERARSNLEVKAEELSLASSYKSQFLASMSHELRTPLNAIIGFSELLVDGAVPLEDGHEYVNDILTSGRHLLQLINDVLDLSKVEAGKLDFFPVETRLSTLVSEVLAVLKTVSAKQHVRITSEISSDVDEMVVDPARLKQVLYNYLSNAIKFSPLYGDVRIRAIAEGSEHVRIEVIDGGTGISADDQKKLFADFQQVADGARKSGGTGLGLALTKRLVEAQGGRVGVISELAKGSTFFAVLPRVSGLEVPPPTLVTRSARAGAPSILVIEDEPLDRAQLVQSLSTAGYMVQAVGTGREALARCQVQKFDAISLDLFLPDMPGLDVLDQLRAGQNNSVPVVVVTVVAERGAVAGFAIHDILPKPLVDSDLVSSLQRAGVKPNSASSVVLVVDDDLASLRVMSATLGQLGYLAVCEQDPRRGLRIATEEPPGAIVLDLLMPNMTGFEFLDEFRANPGSAHVPVIVWTSKDLSTDELARLKRSAHTVVSKGHEGNARVVTALSALLPISNTKGA